MSVQMAEALILVRSAHHMMRDTTSLTITYSKQLLMFAFPPASQVFKDLPAALQSLIMAKSYTLYSLPLQPVGTVQGGNAGHPLLQHEVRGMKGEGRYGPVWGKDG